ncbi:MAG: DUF1549 and DUF1553 domain-containing protein [Planctomycetaceae bacterium]
MTRCTFFTLMLVAFALAGPNAVADSPRPAVHLTISPATISLGGLNRRQRVLVTATDTSGRRFDVTNRCRLSVTDSKVATLESPDSPKKPRFSPRVITGVRDGKTSLRARYGKLTATVDLAVVGYASYPPVHFVNDVVPVLSKLGCNSGGCHGKRSGQNGFRLSIFGSEPRADFASLTRATRGRRVFPSAPDRSLLVRKAIGAVAHGGGRRTTPGSADHRVLAEWIRQGMPWGQDDAPTLKRIDVEPTTRVMGPDSVQQVLVTAVYSDGSRRDVTDAAEYSSNAEVIAEASHGGHVRTGRNPGEAAVTVNYMGQVAAVQLLVPRPNAPSPYPQLPENNRIDALVWAKLRKLGVTPSGLCDDATFLRRLHLDTIGTLPTPKEARAFLAGTRPDKRRRAIDAVLDRPEFADYWALKFADILLVNSEKLGERGAYQFHRWLRRQFAENRPYDEWVRELITATGDTGANGPANFYKALRTKEDLTRAVGQAFLGVRMDCAQCHHHPFEKWGQDDFFGMAGFFNGLQRKSLPGNRELIFHAGFRETKIPLRNRVVPAKPPGGNVAMNLSDGDPRVKLAEWITSPGNPYFARLVANRIWKHYLGRGLVEPEDDLRSTNPATNEPLLAFLAKRLTHPETSPKRKRGDRRGEDTSLARPASARRYDLKALMRLILNARVYQLSSIPNATNAGDVQNFSHHLVKRLPAEVLLDAVSQVTGSPEHFPGLPRGTRTIQLWDNRLPSYFLDTFGRSERASPCECGKSSDPTMAQALHLMNAPEIEAKIADKTGRIARLTASGKTQPQIVTDLCLAAIGRPPNAKERRIAKKLFAGRSQQRGAEDFLWTLLNSYEFLFVR